MGGRGILTSLLPERNYVYRGFVSTKRPAEVSMKSSSLKRRLCGHCQTNIRVEEGGGVITVGVTRPDHLGKTHALRIGVHYRPLR